MNDRIVWLLEVSIKQGRASDFHGLMTEMVASTESEPGTIGYQWTVADDHQTVHILEQFADSAAALVHLAGFGGYAPRFLDVLDVTGLTVYGDPDTAVRDGIAGFAPVFLKPIGGFVRSAAAQLDRVASTGAA